VDCVQATDPHNNSIAATMAIWGNFEDNVSLQFNYQQDSLVNKSIFVHVQLSEGVPLPIDLNRSTRVSVDQYTSTIVSKPTSGIKKIERLNTKEEVL
jgi:hypothetical protein